MWRLRELDGHMDPASEVHQGFGGRARVHVCVGPAHPDKQRAQSSNLRARQRERATAASLRTWRRLSPAGRARTHWNVWNGQRLNSR